MNHVRVLEIKHSVFANNDAQAQALRQELRERGGISSISCPPWLRENHHADPPSGDSKEHSRTINCCLYVC